MSGAETGALLLGSTPEIVGFSAVNMAPIYASAGGSAGLFGAGGAFGVMQTLNTVGTVLTAGSALAGGLAKGEVSDANAAAAAAAALAEEDAAARNAFAQERANRINAETIRDQQQRDKARRMVAWGKSGVTMAGSPIEVEAGAAFLDELNLTRTIQTGQLAVDNTWYAAEQRATKLRSQAALDKYMGGTYRTGGALSAAGSLLTSGAKRYGG